MRAIFFPMLFACSSCFLHYWRVVILTALQTTTVVYFLSVFVPLNVPTDFREVKNTVHILFGNYFKVNFDNWMLTKFFTVRLVSSNFTIWNSVANNMKKSICREPSLSRFGVPVPPKYFRGEIFRHLSRTISRVVHPKKKLHPQFRKSPVLFVSQVFLLHFPHSEHMINSFVRTWASKCVSH